MITLQEIENISLRKSGLGGYKIEDVDSFIDNVIEKVRSLELENKELESRIAAQDKEIQDYKEQEDVLQSVLVSAQMTAKQVITEANKKADSKITQSQEKADKLLAEAKEESEKIVNDAKERADKINAETDAKTNALLNEALAESSAKIEENNKILDTQKRNILKLMGEANKFKNTLLIAYKEHLSLINSIAKGNDLKSKKQELDKNYPAMKGNEPAEQDEKKETDDTKAQDEKESAVNDAAENKQSENPEKTASADKEEVTFSSSEENIRKPVVMKTEASEVKFGSVRENSYDNKKKDNKRKR